LYVGTGTMPAVKILRSQSWTAPARLLVGVAALALLTTGCASSVPGTAAPASAPDRTTAQAEQSPSRQPSRSRGSCQMRVSSNGSIVSNGSGSRVVTRNGRTSLSCGSGPMIAIESMAAEGVTFSTDGTSVTVAPGASETVGPYRISVSEADASGAEFQVEPA
jgi:hypothetical protein